MMAVRQKLRLYLVTDPLLCRDLGLVETVVQAVAGGATMVQLRAKEASTCERVQMALAVKQALVGRDVPLIMNDDLEAATEADIDGAHIGQEDIPAEQARALLGSEKILGLSCETRQAVLAADAGVVDYLGLGPVFGTMTKLDHKKPIGFDGLSQLVALTSLPTVAIGGLKATHQFEVFASGADGQAVVSAICGQTDPKIAAQRFSTTEVSS
ncbi:MAG: thiamine phosphate synthase [Roseobacter sp.]